MPLKKNKKYYVEITDMVYGGYILQSQWFDTIKKAKNWANNIQFLETCYSIDIMVAEFDENDDYGDIEIAEHIRG